MHVGALELDLHLPHSHSLKAKRAVVKPIVDGARQRFAVAVAEVDHHDQWQRAAVGIAVVSATEAHAVEVLDAVERWVWSRPDVEVLTAARSWLDVAG